MSKETKISWVADPTTNTPGRTWNPVTGCDKISSGCDNCYALNLAPRLQRMGAQRYSNNGNPITSGVGFDVTLHDDLISAPLAWRKPSMIFVNSMSDLFHARVGLDFVEQIFETMHNTPQHTYQVLTKRAARLPKIVDKLRWPSNLWLGVSVENQQTLNRVDYLRDMPVSVRFISAEPLLGPLTNMNLDGIDWVIVGGESGANHREMDLDWARDVREICAEQNVAFFFKQVGGKKSTSGGKKLDGTTIKQWPVSKPERCM